MKKYLIAASVAVMVFAFAAMAASLNVNGGVMEMGSDNTMCQGGTTVETDFGGWEQDALGPKWLNVRNLEDACEGEELWVWVRDGNDDVLYTDGKTIPDDSEFVRFNMEDIPAAEDIHSVDVKIQTVVE